MFFRKMLELWKSVLLKPKETFKKERKKADLTLGAKYILISSLIGTAIMLLSLSYIIGLDGSGLSLSSYSTFYISYVIMTPIMSIVGWLIGSAMDYFFARLMGGKGTYAQQTYLIAVYSAPISIISVLLYLIPVAGMWLVFLLLFYSLYLLTTALKEVHGFSTGKAIMSWLLPVIILTAIVLAGVFFYAIYVATYALPVSGLV